MSDYIEAHDPDPTETSDWLESLEAVLHVTGPERARYLLGRLMNRARRGGYLPDELLSSDYVNTILHTRAPATQ